MRVYVLFACLATTVGCAGSEPENVPPPQQAPAHSNRAMAGGPPNSPHGSAPANSPGEPARTTPTEEQIATLQAAFDQSPSNEATKIALVGALVARGDYFMYAENLRPREKYPKALELYRRAVTIDPSNATATNGIATIENIYKSMGRPVPNA